MANSLSVYNPEFWASAAQVLHKPKALYRQLANFRAEAQMKKGDTFHRIRPNRTEVGDYTRYSDIPASDISGTEETLVVSKERAFRFQVDDMDAIQASVDLQKVYGENAAKDLANVVDSDFLYEAVNAKNSIDAGVVGGGTSGLALDLSGSNVYEAFANVTKFLSIENVDASSDCFGVIDPYTAHVIQTQLGARETDLGDELSRMGLKGDKYMGRMFKFAGLDLYVSNNYTRKEVLELATNPTNGDTLVLTIGGNATTITFVSAIGATAGNILIAGTVDGTRANLEAFLNDPGTTSANQVGLQAESPELARFQSAISAVNDDAADEITIYCKGRSIGVSETLTDATDGFSATKRSSVLMLGKKGAVDGVVQAKPGMLVRPEPRNRAHNVMGTALYEFKTFTDGSEMLVSLDALRVAGA